MQLKMNVPFRAKNTPECLDELCKIIKQFLQKLPIEQDKVLNINVNLSGRVYPDLGFSYSILMSVHFRILFLKNWAVSGCRLIMIRVQ